MIDKLKLEVLLSAIDKVTRPLKSVQEGSSATAKALKAAKDQLKGLNDEQGRVDAFRQTARDLAITKNTLNQAQEKVRALTVEIAKVPAPTRDMARALKETKQQAGALAKQKDDLTAKQQRLRSEFVKGGVDTHKLAEYQRTLKQRTSEATQAVGRQTSALSKQNEQIKRLNAAKAAYEKSKEARGKLAGAGATAMGAGVAVGAALAVPVLAYAKAEDSATQLKMSLMQSGGKISDQFKEINALAERLGNKLPGTTSDFQDMMTMLVRQGMPAKALLGGLGEATAYLAVQLKMAPTAAAEFASKLQDATRTTDKDMMGLMDTIQRTFYLGVDQGNMLQAFSKLSPALSILKKEGLGAANALAPLIVMADQSSLVGESAGNAFRKIFQMSLDAKKVAKGNAELSGTGVKLDFTDGKGHSGGIDKILAQLAKLKGVDNDQVRQSALKKIFGDDAETMQALTIMMDKGVDGYREVQAKMAAQASLQERVNLQLGTLKNLWDAASGTFVNALVAFGESVAPELHATAQWMGAIAEKTQAWAKEHPHLAHGIMTVVKWVGLLLVVGGGLLLAISAVLGPLAMMKLMFAQFPIVSAIFAGGLSIVKMALSGVGTAILWLGRMAMAHPLIALISILALGALWVWKNWDTIGPRFWGLVNGITTAFTGLKDKFVTVGAQLIDGLIGGIMAKWESLKATVGGIADGVGGWMKEKLGIKSPSRVFAEIGGYTMAGLENGLLGGKDGPLSAVLSTVKALTAAGAGAGMLIGGAALAMPLDTRPPIGGATAGGMGGAGMTVYITITAAAGSNAQDIAKEVEKAMAQIEARRQAGQRSSLRDKD